MTSNKPAQEERVKKMMFKIGLIIGIFVVAYISLAAMHYASISESKDIKWVRADEFTKITTAMKEVFTNPKDISLGKTAAVIVLTIVAVTGIVVLTLKTNADLRRHDNPKTVNGDAHFMTLDELNDFKLKMSNPIGKPEDNGKYNIILSKDLMLDIHGPVNINILVIGGTGAGKSRSFCGPNILQYNTNYVITDPSGELLRDYGRALEEEGYTVKVFNLTDVYTSFRYNPLAYIEKEEDAANVVDTLIKNTTAGGKSDPFWEKAERLLIEALILYLWQVCPREEQTFHMVTELIGKAEIDENNETMQSKLDIMFAELTREDPHNIAARQYNNFKKAAGKTMKGIIISAIARLEPFMYDAIARLTASDDLDFRHFMNSKQALFVVTPSGDSPFGFLVALLYSQMFQTLYKTVETTGKFGWKLCCDGYTAETVIPATDEESSKQAKETADMIVKDVKSGLLDEEHDETKDLWYVKSRTTGITLGHKGSQEELKKYISYLKQHLKAEPNKDRFDNATCPNHIQFILDEFANIGIIPEFDKKLSTMRKYGISCAIIVQSLSQLKNIYKDTWETIVGNCDTKLDLRTSDSETNKYISEMLGKKTTVVENRTIQSKGGGSYSYNRSSIDLVTPPQLSHMPKDECLVMVSGMSPYWGKKFNLVKHTNYDKAIKLKGAFKTIEDEAAKTLKNRKTVYEQRIEKERQSAELAKLAESTSPEISAPVESVDAPDYPEPDINPTPETPVMTENVSQEMPALDPVPASEPKTSRVPKFITSECIEEYNETPSMPSEKTLNEIDKKIEKYKKDIDETSVKQVSKLHTEAVKSIARSILEIDTTSEQIVFK